MWSRSSKVGERSRHLYILRTRWKHSAPRQSGHKGQGFLASLQSHTAQIDSEITEKTPSKRNYGHRIAGVSVVTTTPNGDP